MNSPRATAEDVRYAYRMLLGREPDAEGYRNFLAYIDGSAATATDIADSVLRSDEFKARAKVNVGLQEVVLRKVRIFPWQGDRLIGDNLSASGDYEPHVLPAFLDALSPGDHVLDVGANIGIYSLLAASKVGEEGRVYAIEPVARNVQSICAGIVANGFRNVSVLPVAASDRASIIGVLRHSDSSNGIVDSSVNGSTLADYVPTQRLDELLAGISRLDAVKIDIEGHEPIAWPGIKSLVERFRPIIFTEFSPVAIRNHSRVAPEVYLDALFEHAVRGVVVMHLDSQRRHCVSSSEIMDEWRRANRDAHLDGVLHLDLMVETR